ncbi:hypothetical protein NIES2104_53530 [Leptolyngbya sp. NIES-2104]|nr:hypothetical protein NIES2104_53530 [Leptolyngbya sp. NIES-2104]
MDVKVGNGCPIASGVEASGVGSAAGDSVAVGAAFSGVSVTFAAVRRLFALRLV